MGSGACTACKIASSTATRGNTVWRKKSTAAHGSKAYRRGSGWWGWGRGGIGGDFFRGSGRVCNLKPALSRIG